MKYKVLAAALIGVAALHATNARAQSAEVRSMPQAGKFSITPDLGTDFNIGGKFVEGASQSFGAAGTISGVSISATATITAKDQGFEDVYDQPLIGGVKVNYGLTNDSEVFGGLRLVHAGGKDFDAFSINAAVTVGSTAVAANATFKGHFSEYNEQALDFGYRKFFNIDQPFKPYVAGSGALRHVNAIDFAYSYAGTQIDKFKFFGESWTLGAGLDVGFRYDIQPGMALGFETGLRYDHDLSGDDSDLADAGNLKKVNDAGNRWSIPVKASLTIQF